ncbi:Apm3 protein [Saccharomycopsis crataegensis]|uniref:Apm3 protein n=1 Tax=Saccharomycopsis crataegensis TaxID=43959 RepID=A0AAV5QR94_9ASCO|nr:Apm3 protein [Saccharomycopsis crataegensis]
MYWIRKMNPLTGIYISDDKNNLVFEYSLSSAAPSFKEVIAKIASATGKSNSSNIDDGPSNSPPVMRLSPNEVIYHQATKYLRYYAVCELEQIAKQQQKNTANNSHEEDINMMYQYDSNKNIKEDYESFQENDQEQDSKADESSEAEEDSEIGSEGNLSVGISSSSFNPLIPLEFIKQLIEVMVDYFGDPLVPLKIEANYDILCLLLSEMIEDNFPFITDLNQLKDVVQFEGILSRFLSSTSSNISKSSSSSNLGGFSSNTSLSLVQDRPSIPWRKNNVKYTNNELFVDFVEHVTLVMSPSRGNGEDFRSVGGSSAFYSTTGNYRNHSRPIISRITGEILLTSHLSGIPDLQMILNLNGHNLHCPTFHPCIRVDRWQNSPGVMSFIPPDGKSRIAEYEIDLGSLPHANRILQNIGIIQGKYTTDLGLLGNEFEITLSISNLKTVKNIETLKLEINTELQKDRISSIKILRLSNGDFQFNRNGKSEWIFDKNLATGMNPVLRGVIVPINNVDDGDNEELPLKIFPNHISLSYGYKGALPSGIKVTSLKVVSAKGMGENVKPYKGVKYIVRSGQVVLR